MYVCVCVWLFIWLSMLLCLIISLSICIYEYMYIYVYIYIYVSVAFPSLICWANVYASLCSSLLFFMVVIMTVSIIKALLLRLLS